MIDRPDSKFEDDAKERPSEKPSYPKPTRLVSVGAALRRNQDLLRNAGSLAATTGITSFLGFAYWIYAARVFPTEAVGYGSAAISTMTLLGTIGMFGLDTMLIGELPRGGNRGGLMMACCVGAFISSFLLGLGFSVVSIAFGKHFVEFNGTIFRIIIFSFGVGITGATFVFDSATIGLMRGGIQLSRNVAVSIAKMAALPVAALILHDVFGVGIMLAWVVGTFLSLIPVAVIIKRSGDNLLHKPDWDNFWRLRGLALAHNWLNLAITAPTKLIPVLVAIVVAPSSNGAYYIATMISSFLFMVPQSLSTVLFAVASAAPEKVAEKLRFVLRMSIAIGIPGGLIIGLLAHAILSAFGSSYAVLATGPLWILLVSYIPGIPNTLYIAVARVKGRFNQASILLTGFAALRMGALVVGGEIGGLYGLSYGMLAISLVQALITTPSVLRAAYGRGVINSALSPASEEAIGVPVVQSVEEARRQQEEGLVALAALATRIAPTRVYPDVTIEGGEFLDQRSRRRQVAVTEANPRITATNWWPDIDESTFRLRQETGIAALIKIATRAAKY